MKNGHVDVLVVGAGINGAVTAAALAGRGASVALIDRADFGGFTSQESSNLVWGGFKYLENYELPLVFTGAMDYWPNVDAVTWFAERIFPAVRDAVPAAQFTIVGSRPGEAVGTLARQPGVVVTGSVPDVRPWLAHAACAIAPLRIARGVQNKVLEAMAMARPVVASSQAAEGLRAEAGRDYILAQGEADFAQAVVAQLQSAQSAAQARDCILAHYDWDRNLAAIDPLFEHGPALARDLETCPT